MKKFLPLVTSLIISAQAVAGNETFIVSSRPLATYYGHPLASELARFKQSEVSSLYISLGFGDGGTSSEQLMYSVALDIQKLKPNTIIVDEVDATSHLLTLLPPEYKSRTWFINRTGVQGVDRDYVFRVSNLARELVQTISEMNLFPDAYYVLYDTTGLTARDSFNLKKNLQGLANTVKFYEVSTVQQLEDLLISFNKNQRGVIVNNMTALTDSEFGTVVKMQEIKDIISRRNTRHLTVGFNFMPGQNNECLIFELDYSPVVQEFFLRGKEPVDMDPLPFKLLVNKRKMRLLGYKNHYIAAFEQIDVIVE